MRHSSPPRNSLPSTGISTVSVLPPKLVICFSPTVSVTSTMDAPSRSPATSLPATSSAFFAATSTFNSEPLFFASSLSTSALRLTRAGSVSTTSCTPCLAASAAADFGSETAMLPASPLSAGVMVTASSPDFFAALSDALRDFAETDTLAAPSLTVAEGVSSVLPVSTSAMRPASGSSVQSSV